MMQHLICIRCGAQSLDVAAAAAHAMTHKPQKKEGA